MFIADLFSTYPTAGQNPLIRARRRTDQPDPGGPTAAPPAPTADSPAPPAPSAPPSSDPPDRGFPENTPIAEMTDAERAAYFKFHDRRKGDTLRAFEGITPEQAKQWKQEAEQRAREQQTPSERALEDARNEGMTAGQVAAAEQWAPAFAQEVIERFVSDENHQQALMGLIDPMKFLKDGVFDKNALVTQLQSLSAAFGGGAGPANQPRQWGQASSTPPAQSGRDEGLAEARRRGYID